MKPLAIAAVVLLLAGGYVKMRSHQGGGAAATTDAVLSCLQASGRSPAIETSSTGQQQIALLHGPVRVSDTVTLEDSKTYITVMASASEAASWAEELRRAPQIPGGSIASSGNVMAQYGLGATNADRVAVAACLA